VSARLRITPPADYLFRRDCCSYGYFLLAPNVWDPATRTLTRPFLLPGGRAHAQIAQPSDAPGGAVTARVDRDLDVADRAALRRQIRRMLNLDDAGVAGFHRADRRWRRAGRGRLFRSPTVFEDLIKTVTSCNVAWPSTITMNRRLCEVIEPAFPAPGQLARRRPQTLRSRCGVGYRDRRIVDLARLITSGRLDMQWLEDPATPDEDAHRALLDLPGIGPYAAGNMMQLLGRYGYLAVDTETIRHGRAVLGFAGSDRAVEKRVRAHYDRFGAHRFRSYWFELWAHYEAKHGPAWTWEPRTTGTQFTAAKLNSD